MKKIYRKIQIYGKFKLKNFVLKPIISREKFKYMGSSTLYVKFKLCVKIVLKTASKQKNTL